MPSDTTVTRYTTVITTTSALATAAPTKALAAEPLSSLAVSEALADPTSAAYGTKLGLAIGIPLAVVSLFGLIALAWVFFKKKISKRTDDVLAVERKRSSSWPLAHTVTSGARELPRDLQKPRDLESRENPFYEPPQKPKPPFLKRLSRMVVPQDLLLPAFRLPLNLRGFNLSHLYAGPPLPAFGKTGPVSGESFVSLDYAGQIFVVATAYKRKLADELTLQVGESVLVKKPHSDGWAAVKLLASGKEGVIPMTCLRRKPE